MKTAVTPVPIAIIGPGRMGRLYAQLLDDLALTRLVALCGESEASTGALADAHGVPGYPNRRYADMLRDHPDIEAVIVCTSEWEHLDPILTALGAGKHVLGEKPMATAPKDAAAMVEAAERAGRHLLVCHSLRFNPRYAIMRQTVARGDIGDILHIHARRNATPPAADRVVGKFPLPYWLMPHDIDMTLWTVGQPAVSVRAESRAGASSANDYITATLTFANGVVARIENTWGTPPRGGRPHGELFTVYGTQGAVEVLGYEHGLAIYRPSGVEYPDNAYSPVFHGQTEGAFRSLVRHFAGVVRGLWAPVVTGRDGLAAIRVAAAIDRALRERREVHLEEIEL